MADENRYLYEAILKDEQILKSLEAIERRFDQFATRAGVALKHIQQAMDKMGGSQAVQQMAKASEQALDQEERAARRLERTMAALLAQQLKVTSGADALAKRIVQLSHAENISADALEKIASQYEGLSAAQVQYAVNIAKLEAEHRKLASQLGEEGADEGAILARIGQIQREMIKYRDAQEQAAASAQEFARAQEEATAAAERENEALRTQEQLLKKLTADELKKAAGETVGGRETKTVIDRISAGAANTEQLLREVEATNRLSAAQIEEASTRAQLLVKIEETSAAIADGAVNTEELMGVQAGLFAQLNALDEAQQRRAQAAREEAQAITTTARQQKQAETQVVSTLRTFPQQYAAIARLVDQYGSFNITLGESQGELSDVQRQFMNIVRTSPKLQEELKKLNQQFGDINVNITRPRFQERTVFGFDPDAIRKTGFALQRLGVQGAAGFGEIIAVAGLAGLAIAGVITITRTLINTLQAMAKAATDAFKTLIENSVEAATSFQAIEIQFRNLFQGWDAPALAAFARVRDESKRLGLDLTEMARSFLPMVDSMDQFAQLAEVTASLLRFRPERTAQDAIIAMAEAMAGQWRSIQTRFNIPPGELVRMQELQKELGLIQGTIVGMQELLSVRGISFEAFAGTLPVEVDRFTEAVRDLYATLGEPVLDALAEKMVELNKWFTENEDALRGFASELGGIVARAIQFAGDRISEFLGKLDMNVINEIIASFGRMEERLEAFIGAAIGEGGERLIQFFEKLPGVIENAVDGLSRLANRLELILELAGGDLSSTETATILGIAPEPGGSGEQILRGMDRMEQVGAGIRQLREDALGAAEDTGQLVSIFENLVRLSKELGVFGGLVDTDVNITRDFQRVASALALLSDTQEDYAASLDKIKEIGGFAIPEQSAQFMFETIRQIRDLRGEGEELVALFPELSEQIKGLPIQSQYLVSDTIFRALMTEIALATDSADEFVDLIRNLPGQMEAGVSGVGVRALRNFYEEATGSARNLADSQDDLADATGDTNEALEEGVDWAARNADALRKLGAAQDLVTSSTEKLTEAQEKLNKAREDALKDITDRARSIEIDHIRDLIDLEEELSRKRGDSAQQLLDRMEDLSTEFGESPLFQFDFDNLDQYEDMGEEAIDRLWEAHEEHMKGVDALFADIEAEAVERGLAYTDELMAGLGRLNQAFMAGGELGAGFDVIAEFGTVGQKAFDKLVDLHVSFRNKQADIALDYARKIEDADLKDARRREDLERQTVQKLLDLERDFQDEMARIRRKADFDAAEAIRSNDAVELLRIRRQELFAIQEARLKRDEGARDITSDADKRREELRIQYEREREDAQIARDRAFEDLQIDIQRRYDALLEEARREQRDLMEWERQKREDLKTEYRRKMEDYDRYLRDRLQRYIESTRDERALIIQQNAIIMAAEQAMLEARLDLYNNFIRERDAILRENPELGAHWRFIDENNPPGSQPPPIQPPPDAIPPSQLDRSQLERAAERAVLGSNLPESQKWSTLRAIPTMTNQELIDLILLHGGTLPQPREHGGPAAPGSSYITGERGMEAAVSDSGIQFLGAAGVPELYRPKRPAYVLNANQASLLMRRLRNMSRRQAGGIAMPGFDYLTGERGTEMAIMPEMLPGMLRTMYSPPAPPQAGSMTIDNSRRFEASLPYRHGLGPTEKREVVNLFWDMFEKARRV